MNRKGILYIIFFLISLLSVSFINRIAFSQETDLSKKLSRSAKIIIRKVAILPLVNKSGSDAAITDIVAQIEEIIGAKQGVEVVSRRMVEKLLIRERIRDIGLISRIDARKIGKILKVDGIIITSVNLLVQNENPIIGIECRMLSGYNGSLMWCDNISLAGRDFTSWFGLVSIKSLNKLIEIAVERLLITFPLEVNSDFEDIYPFEIAEVSVSPRYVQFGKKIDVRVKFVTFDSEIKNVKAILGAQEVPLSIEEKQIYHGIFNAPDKEGKYLLDLKGWDMENKVSMFQSMAIITVDNTPPNVKLFSKDNIFSPNRDRIKDMIFFSPYLKEADNIESWEFVISNSDGKVIRRVGGIDHLPSSIVWRGEDDFYSSVAEGEYFSSMRVVDLAGNESRTPKKRLILDIKPPKALINIEIIEKKGFNFKIDCEDVNSVDRWQLKVLDPDKRVVKSFEGKGEKSLNLIWKTNPSAHKGLTYSFKAKDIVGNTLDLPARQLKTKIDHKSVPSVEEEKKRKEWDRDF
ncbi:MAG: hypothetical protein SVR08_02835 [Spirochaetota bacterium]|nr:hypothetical protein [Spirochaetota bacterium]